MMKPPAFWARPDGGSHPAAWALSPFAALYAWIVKRKLEKADPENAPCPVICIGNVSLGGVGKTPFASCIMGVLKELGQTPHILMRGYGGKLKGPAQVSDHHTAEDVGDEAKMLSRLWPVWVSTNRPEGALAAANAGASVIVMDDGFQNPSLYKDFSFVLIDGTVGFGNGKVFPAGPLRENPEHALQRADAVVIVGGTQGATPPKVVLPHSKPIIRASLKADLSALPPGNALVAFAGIGRPEKFFADLVGEDTTVAATRPFPDHHPYTEREVSDLKALAQSHDATLVTTEKDYARLNETDREGVVAIPAKMAVDQTDLLQSLMEKICLPKKKQ